MLKKTIKDKDNSLSFDTNKLKVFPTTSGVYLMKNKDGKILYIGKAKNLRVRIKQYFTKRSDNRVMVPYLTKQIDSIDTILVSSEKEALLLENNLIKKHQPKYNALLKDDKRYFSVMINKKHNWPMAKVVRFSGKPIHGNLYFGPYTNGYAAKQTLELLRNLFPLRQCSNAELKNRSRPCILYEIDKCIAPCTKKCTKKEYDKHVNSVINFLSGHSSFVVKDLKAKMKKASDDCNFEKANRLYKMIKYIESTLEKQKVEKVGFGDIDVLAIYRKKESASLTQLLFREGKLIASNTHFFSHNAQNDEELISSFILQHYQDITNYPKEIILPCALKENENLSTIISKNHKHLISLKTPKKGNKLSLVAMAQANAESKFKQEKEIENKNEQILVSIEEKFHLINYPERIECFDNSNISGDEPVSSMVVFSNGKADKKRYRKYALKNTKPSDDYGALKEVLKRRYIRAIKEDNLPDLILIDGGFAHLKLAMKIIKELNITSIDLIAISKEKGRHDKGLREEKIFLGMKNEPIFLKPNSPILFFLQNIRDEAHRFAITFQRVRRKKKSLKSKLETIPGIGPVKQKRLLRHFGSVKRIFAATPEEWKQVPSITKKDVEMLKKYQSRLDH